MVPFTFLHGWAPVIALSAAALLVLVLDASIKNAQWARSVIPMTTLMGLLLTGLGMPRLGAAPILFGRGLLIWDALAWVTLGIAMVSAALVTLLASSPRALGEERPGPAFSLILLSTLGLYFLGTAHDLVMVFLAIELVGIPLFVLVGYYQQRRESIEGAMKFFLIAVFSSAMLVYGISLLYGHLGTTSLVAFRAGPELLAHSAPLLVMGLTLVLIAVGYKVGLVPFHLWVPDAFSAAPPAVSAYLSVAPKIAGLILLLRIFSGPLASGMASFATSLGGITGVTLLVGTLMGLRQTNVVRLLAYSSIAHMGFMLFGVLAGTAEGIAAIYLYGWAYLFMNIGAFTVVGLIATQCGSTDLSAFRGLSSRSPFVAALMALFLFSLAGLPPLAGFVVKFTVLATAFHSGWQGLVIFGLVNAVAAIGYYFKILHAMYFQTPESESPLEVGLQDRVVLAVTSLFTLVIGLAPQPFLAYLRALVQP